VQKVNEIAPNYTIVGVYLCHCVTNKNKRRLVKKEK